MNWFSDLRRGSVEQNFFFFFTFIYLVTLYLFVRLYLIFFLSKSIFFLRVVERDIKYVYCFLIDVWFEKNICIYM